MNMELAVLVILAIVVAIVAVDAIAKLDAPRVAQRERTEKIIVDLSKRR